MYCTLLKGVLEHTSAPPPPKLHNYLFINLRGTIKRVLHHLPGQHPAKLQLRLRNRTLPSSPTVHRIHLSDRTQESKLPHCPPLRPPSLLQSNRIVTTIVDVVDPVLGLGVPAEGLGVLEALPVAVDLSIGRMVLDCLQHAVGRHDL